MQRRHAPRTTDPEHEEEHALMMVWVRGVDAAHELHWHDSREYNLPGRRRRRRARDAVAEHLATRHGRDVGLVLTTEELLDLHDEAHREDCP